MFTRKYLGLGVMMLGVGLLPAWADSMDSHFAHLAFNSTTHAESIVNGQVGGSFSLTSVSQYDEDGNLCSGYSYDGNLPNHVLDLSASVDHPMSIWVNSGGHDTTLMIKNGDHLYCSDDISAVNLDAGITRKTWSAGVYQVWVGSNVPGQNYSYQLKIKLGDLPQSR